MEILKINEWFINEAINTIKPESTFVHPNTKDEYTVKSIHGNSLFTTNGKEFSLPSLLRKGVEFTAPVDNKTSGYSNLNRKRYENLLRGMLKDLDTEITSDIINDLSYNLVLDKNIVDFVKKTYPTYRTQEQWRQQIVYDLRSVM